MEVALFDILRALARDRRPSAAVPQHHRAAAIFARRDRALEIGIGQRMVLGADREALLVGVDARPARHRPALEHAVDFETEIPMEARGVVLLDDEAVAVAGLERAGGLGGLREIALGVVCGERVGHLFPPPACGRGKKSIKHASSPARFSQAPSWPAPSSPPPASPPPWPAPKSPSTCAARPSDQRHSTPCSVSRHPSPR